MSKPAMPKTIRGRKWLMLAIANVVLQIILSLILFSIAGSIGLVAVIFFQAFLITVASYYESQKEITVWPFNQLKEK